jgi:hypothetical protein
MCHQASGVRPDGDGVRRSMQPPSGGPRVRSPCAPEECKGTRITHVHLKNARGQGLHKTPNDHGNSELVSVHEREQRPVNRGALKTRGVANHVLLQTDSAAVIFIRIGLNEASAGICRLDLLHDMNHKCVTCLTPMSKKNRKPYYCACN